MSPVRCSVLVSLEWMPHKSASERKLRGSLFAALHPVRSHIQHRRRRCPQHLQPALHVVQPRNAERMLTLHMCTLGLSAQMPKPTVLGSAVGMSRLMSLTTVSRLMKSSAGSRWISSSASLSRGKNSLRDTQEQWLNQQHNLRVSMASYILRQHETYTRQRRVNTIWQRKGTNSTCSILPRRARTSAVRPVLPLWLESAPTALLVTSPPAC